MGNLNNKEATDKCIKCHELLKSYGIDCPQDCNYDEARKIMKKLMLKNHPDKHPEEYDKYNAIFTELSNCNDLVIKEQCMKDVHPDDYHDIPATEKKMEEMKEMVKNEIMKNSVRFENNDYFYEQYKRFRYFMFNFKVKNVYVIDKGGMPRASIYIRSTRNLGPEIFLEITVYFDMHGKINMVIAEDYDLMYGEKYDAFNLEGIFLDMIGYFGITEEYASAPYWVIDYTNYNGNGTVKNFWVDKKGKIIQRSPKKSPIKITTLSLYRRSPRKSPKKSPKKSPRKTPKKSPKKSPKKTIAQVKKECKERGLVYDVPTKKCRESKRGKKRSSKRVYPAKKSKARRSRSKKSPKKTIKQIKAECKDRGLVYDVPTKKCRESKRWKKRSSKRVYPAKKSKARRSRKRRSSKKCPSGTVLSPSGRCIKVGGAAYKKYFGKK
jgi:hypothetical protein